MSGLLLWAGSRRRLLLTTVALVATGLVSVYSRGLQPHATWRQALDWGTGSTNLIGAVAAGLTAWQYARMRQAAFAELVSSARRDLGGWCGPAVLVWLQGTIALLITTAVTTGTTIALSIPSHPGDLPILLQALAALATYVALGACLGTLVGQPWIAPVAAVLGYLLLVLSISGFLPGTFDTGSATGSLVGTEFNVAVIALQGVVAVGLAAALAQGALSVLAARHRLLSGLLALALLAGIGAYLRLSSSGYERYAYPDGPVPVICEGTNPEVCVARDAPRPLTTLSEEFSRQAPKLERLGFEVPARFQVPDFFRPNPPGVGVINFVDDQEASGDADPSIVSEALATPADCDAYSADVPDMRVLTIHFVLQDWVAHRLGVRRQDSDSDLGRWMRSPAALEWARTVYPGLASCDFRGLDVPPAAREGW